MPGVACFALVLGPAEFNSFLLSCYEVLNFCFLKSFQHPGRGIDVRRRKIWDMYGPQTRLEVLALFTHLLSAWVSPGTLT